MSANKDHVEVFPFETIVSIELSGAFYVRLTQLMLDYASLRDINQLGTTLEELNHRDPKDNYEYNLLTLVILIKEIEATVRKENKFEKIDESIFQKPDEDSNSDLPQSQQQPESQD
jgi:hypothetical protein